MNIFKILASGDGSIKEPSITAFLGYLLDPYEDHSFKASFLELLLKKIVFAEEANSERFKHICKKQTTKELSQQERILH